MSPLMKHHAFPLYHHTAKITCQSTAHTEKGVPVISALNLKKHLIENDNYTLKNRLQHIRATYQNKQEKEKKRRGAGGQGCGCNKDIVQTEYLKSKEKFFI